MSSRKRPVRPGVSPLLIAATFCWFGLAALGGPLFVHPYLMHGLEHVTHFYSSVWTASFVIVLFEAVAVVPLAAAWWRSRNR